MTRKNDKQGTKAQKVKLFFSKIIRKKWMIFLLSFLVFVLFVFLIPVLINEAYKVNAGYTTLWCAADVLSFYSVVLSGLITIAALIVTIYFSKIETERQIRFSQSQTNAPFFIIDKVVNQGGSIKSNGKITWQEQWASSKYIDSQNNTIIFLKNIGAGIAIMPDFEIDLLPSISVSNPEFIINGQTLKISYKLYDVLATKYDFYSLPKTTDRFNSCITLRYQNILGIKYEQKITITHEWIPNNNSIAVSLNDVSHQKVKTL